MSKKFYIWQNGMCISYLVRLRQMEEFLDRNSWEKTDNMQDADCILIGACAAFEPYFDMYAKKMDSIPADCGRVIVYGCLPSINYSFFKERKNNAVFIPSRFPSRIENIIESPVVPWKDIFIPSEFRRSDYSEYVSERRYIIIQEGCSEKCFYCPHYLGIGSEKSRNLEDILFQIQLEKTKGGKVFVIEGNNGGSWGLDLAPRQTYPDLLKAILELGTEIEIHIGDFAPKWIRSYGDCLNHPQITDIKIPIQSTSSRLLRQMGRDPYIVEAANILKSLKKAAHHPVLRTEIIIGLPTSTDEELLDTLEFCAEHFNKVACFSYDFHANTKIAKMNIQQLDDEVIRRQVELAMDFSKRHPDVIFVFNNRGRICSEVTNKAAVI